MVASQPARPATGVLAHGPRSDYEAIELTGDKHG